MPHRNTSVALAIAATALAGPAQGQAAGLTLNKPCYGGGDTLVMTGTGFSANAPVALTVNTRGVNLGVGDRRTNPAGVFQFTSLTPTVADTARRTDTFTAIDRVKPVNRAFKPVLLSRLKVRIAPRSGNPLRRRRIRAAGFTTGRTLYAHIRRGGRVRNLRIGRLRGACKSLSVRRRLFRRFRAGTYRVQFDVARRYRRTRAQRIVFRVVLFRTLRPAAATAATVGEDWRRLR